MKFTQQQVINLRVALGPLYNVQLSQADVIEINTPLLNQINDNYRVFITPDPHQTNQYIVDDDGDTLFEFDLMQKDATKAKQYIKQHAILYDDMVQLKATNDTLIDMILKNITLQMQLETLITKGLNDDE